MESSLYAGGEDDEFVKEIERKGVTTEREIVPSRADNVKSGVFRLPIQLSVGAAMCWEQVRYRTARRMRGQVDFMLTASGWPGGRSDPEDRRNPAPARASRRRAGRPREHRRSGDRVRTRPTARARGRCSFPVRARSWTAPARASRSAASPRGKACSSERSIQAA